MHRSFRHLICIAALAATILGLALGAARPVRAQGASDPGLVADQRALVQAQIETEKARLNYYNRQIEIEAKARRTTPFMKKFLDDPADAVGSMGAVIGMLIAFFVIMGNREANRHDRRDAQFHGALLRFGEGAPSMRAASAGIVAQMGSVRERRSYPYLDTAVSQLIAGYRLEENEAVRQAIADGLKELIEAEPLRVRRKLSDAGIKLPGD